MLSGCGLGGLEFGTPSFTQYVVVPANPTIASGQQLQMNVQVVKDGGTPKTQKVTDYSWASDDASVFSVTSSGLATGLKSGSAKVRATLKTDHIVSISTTVTVIATLAQGLKAGTGTELLLGSSGSNDDDRAILLSTDTNDLRTFRSFADEEASVIETRTQLNGRGPAWLAVDQANSLLYVLDRESREIESFRFFSDGTMHFVAKQPLPGQAVPSTISLDECTLEVRFFGEENSLHLAICPGGTFGSSCLGTKINGFEVCSLHH